MIRTLFRTGRVRLADIVDRFRTPAYNVADAHPDPDVEEFAIWLAETVRKLPRRRRIAYWRTVADMAADARFLRYSGPGIKEGT